MSGEGCASGVVPVLIVGGQLLGAAGLNHIHPFGKLYLTGPERNKYKKLSRETSFDPYHRTNNLEGTNGPFRNDDTLV